MTAKRIDFDTGLAHDLMRIGCRPSDIIADGRVSEAHVIEAQGFIRERAVVAKVFPQEGAPYYEMSSARRGARRRRQPDNQGAANH